MTSDSPNQLRLKPLQDLIIGEWDDTAKKNRASLGDSWALAEEFVRLHVQALQEISRSAGSNPSESDKAVILLGGHGFNLYLWTIGLAVRGLFDVASHLVRGLFDCWPLLYATAKDQQLARKFAEDRLEASDARKLVIQNLRKAGEEGLANDINDRFKADSEAANLLAHVKMLHGDKLLAVGGNSITPVLGGRADANQSKLLCKAAHLQEHWMLTCFLQFRGRMLSPEWASAFDAAQSRFRQVMKA